MSREEPATTVEEIGYRVHGRIRSARPGMHAGTLSGQGLEALSHETLLDGRDARRIDKLASARDPLRRLLVRSHRQPATLNVIVVADLSASMGFRGHADKLEMLAALTASLGFSAARAGDAFGFVGCGDAVIPELLLPPTRARGAALDLADRLRRRGLDRAPGRAAAAGLVEAPAFIAPRRSLVFLASDFHLPLALVDELLRALARHLVVPVVLADGAELQPRARLGIARVFDLETGERRLLLMRPSLRRRLERAAVERRAALAALFDAHGVEPLRLEDRFDADRVNAYFHR